MVDYEEIRSGRRREWWKRKAAERMEAENKLPPLEEMARLIKNADNEEETPSSRRARSKRDQEEEPPEDFGLPGPPPDPALLDDNSSGEEQPARGRNSRTRFDFEREKDRKEWEKTRRQLIILGAIAGAVLLVLLLLNVAWRAMAGNREVAEMTRYMKMATEGESINDLSDPIRALATYRSAWIRGDMDLIWSITTRPVKKDILAVRTQREHLLQQNRQYKNGGYREWVDVMKGMTEPTYMYKPTRPYGNGDLVAFLSQPYKPAGARHPSQRYVVAFVYVHGEWQFLENVPETAWRKTWDSIYDVKPGASIEDTW